MKSVTDRSFMVQEFKIPTKAEEQLSLEEVKIAELEAGLHLARLQVGRLLTESEESKRW